jgi:hypothetical protein
MRTVYSPPAWLAGMFQEKPATLSTIAVKPEATVSPLGPLISKEALPEVVMGVWPIARSRTPRT